MIRLRINKLLTLIKIYQIYKHHINYFCAERGKLNPKMKLNPSPIIAKMSNLVVNRLTTYEQEIEKTR